MTFLLSLFKGVCSLVHGTQISGRKPHNNESTCGHLFSKGSLHRMSAFGKAVTRSAPTRADTVDAGGGSLLVGVGGRQAPLGLSVSQCEL